MRGTCSVEGCDRPEYGRSYCNMHWQRWRRHGDPLTEPKRQMGPIEPGTRFGRLTVTSFSHLDAQPQRWYVALCDCGTEVTVLGSRLTGGRTQSCGCLREELLVARSLTHGHRRGQRDGRGSSQTYNSWQGLLSRCRRPTDPFYESYGGRGISVCARWDTAKGGSFENFLADMGERPAGTSIDRIDPDGNYEPGNCRWATAKEQRGNRRSMRGY